MSKESIGRDRWRQLGQTSYSGWCPGCGLYAYIHRGHRADCTARNPQEVWACPTAS